MAPTNKLRKEFLKMINYKTCLSCANISRRREYEEVPEENYTLPYHQTNNISNGETVIIKLDVPVPLREEPKFPKEKWKTFISFVILAVNFILATVSLSLVHERLPDRETYRPLPDIVLDNITSQDWALNISEILIMITVNSCILLIIFHKHRENEWIDSQIKLLIQTRLEFEDDFSAGRRKRSVLWQMISTELKKTDPNLQFSVENMKTKYYNLFTTYKRVKHRQKSSGSGKTHWPYYELFDQNYGTKHSIEPPQNNSISTFKVQPENESAASLHNDNEDLPIETDDICESGSRRTNKKRKKEEEEKQRHREFMDIATKKLAIEEARLKILQVMLQILQLHKK